MYIKDVGGRSVRIRVCAHLHLCIFVEMTSVGLYLHRTSLDISLRADF